MPATETDRVVDVRTIDDPPFDAILASLGEPVDEYVVVIDNGEPTELYDALDERGLSYRTTRSAGDWYVHVSARDPGRATTRTARRGRSPRIESIADLANPELL